MPGNTSESRIVRNLSRDFDMHVKDSPRELFFTPQEVYDDLGRLARRLTEKKELGQLTESESQIMQDMARLKEKIADFNNSLSKRQVPVPRSAPSKDVPVTAKISEEEAEKIINHLNEQFEEKVLRKLRPSAPAASPPDKSPDFSAAVETDGSAGRGLSDYLSTVRDDRPIMPFMDEDSHIDLSKLHGLRSGQEN